MSMTPLSGEKGERRREMFQTFLAHQKREYFESLLDDIAFDRGDERSVYAPDAAQLSATVFFSSRSIQTRGKFVKNKSWFGLHSALRELLSNWTIMRESLRVMAQDRLDKKSWGYPVPALNTPLSQQCDAQDTRLCPLIWPY